MTLHQVLAVYPTAKLDVSDAGVSLWTSPPPIATKTVSFPTLPVLSSYPQVVEG